MNITKLSYADPRPYWASQDVTAFKCSTQFGNPSGHSETSIGMALTVWLDFDASKQFKGITLVLTLLFAVTIGYSRFFLGVHSMDQIVYGLLIGTWIAITMHYIIRPKLDVHVKSVILGKI